MRIVRNLTLVFLLLAAAAISTQAQTSVSSPVNGSQVGSPFNLTMYASTCYSNPVAFVGYSIDDSPNTAIFAGQAMNGPVTSGAGWHTIYIKVWDNYGNVCVTTVSVDVVSVNATSVIPSYAAGVGNIQALPGWAAIHDGGTPGWSVGALSITSWPSLSGSAGYFANEFGDYGGERYAVQFSSDTASQNLFYDAWVFIASDSNGFSNLEFDLNQTMPSGETAIMGFQCDTWNNTWDYAVNAGSPTQFNDTWGHSDQPCNIHNWAPNTWHHVQIYFSHDYNGWVTYHTVWLDGAEQDVNLTVFSGFSLGWGPAITTQFQIDGNSPGTTWGNVILDAVTVYYW
jgi:hypothetical protein